MTKELEPCPFCGGEVKLDRNFIICDTCAVRMERAIVYPRWHEADELIQRWNARYKRTCNMVAPNRETMPYPRCSACGAPMLNTPNRYCAQCGAEVVDGD